jgi:5'-nucleotidase / UDP-sugar diphosphatase
MHLPGNKAIYKFWVLALVVLMPFTILACDSGDDDDDATTTPSESDDRWPACDPTAQTQVVSFVHVSDIHAHYNTEPGGENPVARMRGYFEQVKEENPYALFTNGGDDHEKGSVAEEFSDGMSTTEVANAMAFDIRVIGNHDFAFGPQELLLYSRDPEAVVLASNTEYLGNDADGFGAVDYVEFQVGCVRIGFFGLVSMPWNEKNEQYAGNFYPDNDDFQSDWDWAVIANSIIAEHGDDVDLLINLSHLGLHDDMGLADEVTGIDVYLGGHTHSSLTEPTIRGESIIVHPGAFSEYVSRLDLTIDLDSSEIVDYTYQLLDNVEGAFPINEELQLAVDNILDSYVPDMHDAVATVAFDLDEDGVALVATMAAIDVYSADAAMVSKNTVWKPWPTGSLSMQDMFETFKVERELSGTTGFNSLYLATVTGGDLQRIEDEMTSLYQFTGPEVIDDSADYLIALQKTVAYNPGDYLPEGVTISDLTFGDEVWKVLDLYGRARQLECLPIDSDEPISGCQ